LRQRGKPNWIPARRYVGMFVGRGAEVGSDSTRYKPMKDRVARKKLREDVMDQLKISVSEAVYWKSEGKPGMIAPDLEVDAGRGETHIIQYGGSHG